MKLTQTTAPTLGGQKTKGRKNSNFFKERIQLSLKKVEFFFPFGFYPPKIGPVACVSFI